LRLPRMSPMRLEDRGVLATPTSPSTSLTSGCTGFGANPALSTSIRSPVWCRNSPSAIGLRTELSAHKNTTVCRAAGITRLLDGQGGGQYMRRAAPLRQEEVERRAASGPSISLDNSACASARRLSGCLVARRGDTDGRLDPIDRNAEFPSDAGLRRGSERASSRSLVHKHVTGAELGNQRAFAKDREQRI